jgi:ADP-ribosylglycohydrolase
MFVLRSLQLSFVLLVLQVQVSFSDSDISDRYIGSVVGSFVADAATMGLHWIYDPLEIQRLVETRPDNDPAFFIPPSSPYYQYESGELSPYGAEAFAVLQVLAGRVNITGQELTSGFVAHMKQYPGYRNKATRFLIENAEAGLQFPRAGADDEQANALVKAAVAAARYSGRPDFLQRVEDAVRMHQNTDLAARCGVAAAAIIDRIARGAAIPDALRWAASDASPLDPLTRSDLRAGEAALPPRAPAADAARAFGASCALPGALLAALHIVRSSATFEDAVRANIRAGGDQCSRAALIGACFGAAAPAAVPAAWAARVRLAADVRRLAAAVRAHAAADAAAAGFAAARSRL